MKNKKFKYYISPTIKVHIVEMEESLSSTSITINATEPILEEWSEEEIIFDKIEW